MASVQYVTDDKGTPVAVQIPIREWRMIEAELQNYDGEIETVEIMADKEFISSLKQGQEQLKRRKGKPVSEVPI